MAILMPDTSAGYLKTPSNLTSSNFSSFVMARRRSTAATANESAFLVFLETTGSVQHQLGLSTTGKVLARTNWFTTSSDNLGIDLGTVSDTNWFGLGMVGLLVNGSPVVRFFTYIGGVVRSGDVPVSGGPTSFTGYLQLGTFVNGGYDAPSMSNFAVWKTYNTTSTVSDAQTEFQTQAFARTGNRHSYFSFIGKATINDALIDESGNSNTLILSGSGLTLSDASNPTYSGGSGGSGSTGDFSLAISDWTVKGETGTVKGGINAATTVPTLTGSAVEINSGVILSVPLTLTSAAGTSTIPGYIARTNKRYYSVNGSSGNAGTQNSPWRSPSQHVTSIPQDCEHIFIDAVWTAPDANEVYSTYNGRPIMAAHQTFRSLYGYLGTKLVGNGAGNAFTLITDPTFGYCGQDLNIWGMEWTNWIPPGNGGGGVFTIGGDLDTLSIVGNSFHDNQMANNNLGHVFYLGHAGNTYATAARNIEISYNIVNEQRNIGYFLHQWSGSFSYVPWNVAVKNNLVNLKGISGFLIAPAAGGPRNWQVWDNDIRVDGSDPRNQNQAPLDSSAYCSAIDFYQGEALNSGGVWSNGVDSTFDMRRNVFVVKGGNGPVVRMKTVSGSGTQHNPTHASNQYWNTVSNGNVVGGDRAAFYSVSGETVAAPATQATGFQDKATLFTGSLKLPPGFWKSKVDGTNSLGNASVTSSNVVEVTELVGAGTMPSSYSVAPITVTPSSIQVGVNGNASFTVTDKTGYELAGAQCVSASTARATVSSTTDADGVATVTGISGPSTTITISFLDPVTNSTVTYDLPVVVTGGATSDTGFFNFVPL